jgi:two-component system cell cycle sensor histidine kinase/response regulator CckA
LEANPLYQELFASSPDGILLIDADTQRVIECNEGACRQLGYTREEFVGLRISDYEALQTPEEIRTRVQDALRDGTAEFDTVQRTKTGELRDVHVWAKTFRLDGRVVFHAIFRDITERRRTDELQRLHSAALNAAADAVVITDRAGIIAWVNPAFTRLTGYTAEEAVGQNLRDLVKSDKHTPAFFKDFWETILAGRTWHGEMINRRKDGRLYTEDQVVTPILDASGAITHFVAIKEDMTERLQLEAQFLQAQKMESVGQLASGIAHDFNNLLTVINGMSELVLAQVSPTDPVRADAEEIHRAGERAATLTRQLLAFSRQQILAPRVMDVNTVVAGVEGLLRRLLGEDIALVVELAPGAGSVKADPGQIEQVITNLAVNARDAMPQGGQLMVETQPVQLDEAFARQHGAAVPPGSYVRLAVSDSGVGMDETTRARIFEPFFTTKGPGKGTGLGLSTVYGIVKQSHGFIWASSEVGQGTSFKMYLPQVGEAASIAPPAPTVVSTSGTETILLVEDNAGLRKLATRFLEPAGYTVLGAATGEEALRLLDERQVDPVHLLLSDVVMPGMSGRQLAEQLAQTRPGMKVLYMSGYTSDTIVRHGVLEAQMSFLNKPFTAVALLRKVREVLDS